MPPAVAGGAAGDPGGVGRAAAVRVPVDRGAVDRAAVDRAAVDRAAVDGAGVVGAVADRGAGLAGWAVAGPDSADVTVADAIARAPEAD